VRGVFDCVADALVHGPLLLFLFLSLGERNSPALKSHIRGTLFADEVARATLGNNPLL